MHFRSSGLCLVLLLLTAWYATARDDSAFAAERASVIEKPSSQTGNPAEDTAEIRLRWSNGFQIETQDEKFKMRIGGNLQFDNGWSAIGQQVQFGPGGIGSMQDGALFRRARIRTEGTLYQHFEWLAEFDFANSVENDTSSSSQTIGTPSFTNVWLGVNDLPWIGTLRMGWMVEPLDLENSTSNRFLPFMERMPGNPLFTSPGIMITNYRSDERATWALGVFHSQNNNFGFGYGDGEVAYTGRITWLPLDQCDGERIIHLGVGASHRHLDDDQIKLSGRPTVRTMPSPVLPSLAATDVIGGSTDDIINFELAGVYNSWTLQSEYFARWIHDAIYPYPSGGVPVGTLFYQGAYFEVLYFLTGEHQTYRRKEGEFGRVEPLHDFNPWETPHGWGAWQIGLRYAYLDFQSKGVNGATLHDITLGLNWFLNPQAKVQWNLELDHRDSTPSGSDGWVYVFGIRLSVDY